MLHQQRRKKTMLNKGNVLTQKGTLTEEGYSFDEVKNITKKTYLLFIVHV